MSRRPTGVEGSRAGQRCAQSCSPRGGDRAHTVAAELTGWPTHATRADDSACWSLGVGGALCSPTMARGDGATESFGGGKGPMSPRGSMRSSAASEPIDSADMDARKREESVRAVLRGVEGLLWLRAPSRTLAGLGAGVVGRAGERAGLTGCEARGERLGLLALMACVDEHASEREGVAAADVLSRPSPHVGPGDAAAILATSDALTSPRAPGASDAKKDALSWRRAGDVAAPAPDDAEPRDPIAGERGGSILRLSDAGDRRGRGSSSTSDWKPARKLALRTLGMAGKPESTHEAGADLPLTTFQKAVCETAELIMKN